MFKKIRIFLIIILLVAGMCEVNAVDSYIPVRVGISDTKFQKYLYDSIEFNNPSEIDIMDPSTGYTVVFDENTKIVRVVSENNLFSVYSDDKLLAKNIYGSLYVRPKHDCLISINNLKRKGKQALYRGYIELKRSEKDISKFAVVNILSLKSYLKGVVPNEMPVRFGLEALKAQTVAARNYAVTPRVKAYKEFDLCDSVACQVYYGANTEDELSNRAIEETNGIIAVDKEYNPILALYSSTAGGYTESYEYSFSDPKTREFPSEHLSYLVAVPDDKNFKTLETDEEAEKFYTSKPEAFDDKSPYYRWEKEWSKEELEKVLSKTLIAQSKTGFVVPQLLNSDDFGSLESIKALKRGESGKIIKLEIKTDKNTFTVMKELVIRRCFQKNGISLPSANFVITKIDSENPVYKFSGGGFGHGVGLSQWGAGKMSSLGYSYDKILQHYYKGILLSTIPMKVKGSSKEVEQEFYTLDKKAQILIENPNKIKEIRIKVNKRELNAKLSSGKNLININRYVEKGLNKVSYSIMDEDADYNKYITASVIVKEAQDE